MNTFPNNQIIFNILAFDNCHRRGKFAELGVKINGFSLTDKVLFKRKLLNDTKMHQIVFINHYHKH
jgi:hypothetical protein